MAKHPFFKAFLVIPLLLLLNLSCSGLRENEQTDCAHTTINFSLDASFRNFEGTMVFTNKNSGSVSLKDSGFFLLPEETGGSLKIDAVRGDNLEFWKVENSVLKIEYSTPMPTGESYALEIDFRGKVPRDLHLPGIFFRTEDTVALGHFYPLPIPLNDQGSFTTVYPSNHGDPVESILSSFDVTFKAPNRLRFAASGIVERGKKEGDFINCSVSTGPVRDFYLLGSAKWDMVTKVYDGIRINSWYPEGRMQQGIDSVFYIEEALKIFEKHLSPYPYNVMNIVSGPLGSQAGGMEYPGIIVLNDDYYIDENSFMLQAVIAHEIGHQWFYNLVGNDPVMEPWLDESFTSYVTWLYFEKLYGTRAGNRMASFYDNRWARVGKENIPLNRSVHDYHGREYGAIPYGKGPLFLFALLSEFGEEAFDEFIRSYLRDYRWKRINTEELRDYMYGFFGETGDEMFRQWVYGEPFS